MGSTAPPQYTPETDSPTTTADATRPSVRVVEAVADAKGIDPLDVEPLSHAVDPDALDALFAPRADATPRDADASLQFTFAGHTVVVDADGTVVVAEE